MVVVETMAGTMGRAARRGGAVVAIGVIGLIGLLVAWAMPGMIGRAETLPPGTAVPDQGNEHISTLDTPHPPYNSEPPTSGWHIPFIAKWGIHKQPIPRELQVHNLEDGGVVIQYSCPTPCPDLVKKLERLAKRYLDRTEPRFHHLLVAPWLPDQRLPSRLALTAWGRIDRLDAYDEARVTRFIEAYIGVDHHKGSRPPTR